jgi:dTDP-glucose 4,6-dehydratase
MKVILSDIENKINYTFIKGDIIDELFTQNIFQDYKFDSAIHLAAELNVDISIANPLTLAKTNILRIMVLLNSFKIYGKLIG